MVDGQDIAYGAYVQSKHFEPLYTSDNIGGELQNMYFDGEGHSVTGDGVREKCNVFNMDESAATATYQNYYYVDHSIMTLNSPDIELQDSIKNLDMENYSIRVTGYIPFNFNYSKQNIIADSPLFLKKFESATISTDIKCYDQSKQSAFGFYDNSWGDKEYYQGRIVSRLSWFDDVNGIFKYKVSGGRYILSCNAEINDRWNRAGRQYAYNTYPFQREYLNNYNKGALNSTGSVEEDVSIEDIESSRIIKKVLSNIKYANSTRYFDADAQNNLPDSYDISTSDIKLFDLTEDQFVRVDGKIYRGNVD